MKRISWGWSASLVMAVTVARADDPARAAQSFTQARDAYERGDFATAAVGFEQAAAYKAHPGALLNASAAWEEAGDLPRATAACDRALELATDNPTIAGQAKACLAKLTPKVATLAMTGPPSWRVRIDDSEPAALPVRRRLVPGGHTIAEYRADGALAATKRLELAGGQNVALTFEDPRPAPAPVKSERRIPVGSVVAWSAGGAALIAAGIFGVRAIQAKDSYDSAPSRAAQSDFHQSRDLTNVSLAVAGVAAVVGIVVYVATPPRRISPAVGGHPLRFTF
jgi:tetratricopeptide (TPR) repeat protein